MTDIIVFHTAWMAKYDGLDASFSAGGFRYAKEHGYGHEMLNFRDVDGSCYGYVPPTRGDLNFGKYYDVDADAETLEGVTVVWTAPHPEKGGRAIVGIWRNATVYRTDQIPSGRLAQRRTIDKGEIASYRCKAKATDCVLLPPEDRPIFVPAGFKRRGEAWPGMNSVFYPRVGKPAHLRLLELLANIDRGEKIRVGSDRKAHKSLWQVDVERRIQIEEAAVKAVGKSLERRGFVVESVEKENLGYDLVAKCDDEVLHVEVKGRSGSDIDAELTVNEYLCLKDYARQRDPDANYRVAIVTDALAKPVIHEFVLARGKPSSWITLDGKWQLAFEEHIAARVTAKAPSDGAD